MASCFFTPALCPRPHPVPLPVTIETTMSIPVSVLALRDDNALPNFRSSSSSLTDSSNGFESAKDSASYNVLLKFEQAGIADPGAPAHALTIVSSADPLPVSQILLNSNLWRLPSEVLGHIFRFTAWNIHASKMSAWLAVLTLSRVCAHWRACALADSLLWATTLTVHGDYGTESYKAWIERSQDVLLDLTIADVTVGGEFSNIATAMTRMGQWGVAHDIRCMSPRIRSIDYTFRRVFTASNFFKLLFQILPRGGFHHMSKAAFRFIDGPVSYSGEVDPFLLFDDPIGSTISSTATFMPAMKTLMLGNLHELIINDGILRWLLSMCSDVDTLILDRVVPDMCIDPHAPPIILSNLRRLWMSAVVYLQNNLGILSLFSAPNVEELYLVDMNYMDFILFVQHITQTQEGQLPSKIRKLHLEGLSLDITPPEFLLQHWYHSMPQLEELSINGAHPAFLGVMERKPAPVMYTMDEAQVYLHSTKTLFPRLRNVGVRNVVGYEDGVVAFQSGCIQRM